jgi:hypothetical protein
MKLGTFSADFRKISNIKLHEIPSSGSRVVPCGRTDRQTRRSQHSIFEIFANTSNQYREKLTDSTIEAQILVEPTGQEVKTTAGRYQKSTDREKEPEMSIKIHFRVVIL